MARTETNVRLLAILTTLLLTPPYGGVVRADEPDAARVEAANRMLRVFETILDKHVAPPTRQEMLLRGCRAIVAQDDLVLQASLARQVSDLSNDGEMVSFLARHLPAAEHSNLARIEDNFTAAALTAVPGGARLIKAKEFAVAQQLRENRYVGIGIVLAKQGNYPAMPKVIPGGPAYRAGGKNGDLMISIDDLDATRLSLPEVIEILRGQEGKPVSIVVKQPDSDQERRLDIVRGEVPLGSVEGLRRDANDEWVHRVSDESNVAYVKLAAIRGSSARELKQTAQRLHAQGLRALILDLQALSAPGELRHAVMIADELLGSGRIGAVVHAGAREEYSSTPDQLFAAWPMVVLVGARTQGQAEWIAAALQDNERATVLGQRTLGLGFVQHTVKLDNGDAIEFRSGVFERSNGKSLVSQGRMVETVSPDGMLRAVPATRPQQPPSPNVRQPGWKGIQPDQLATTRQVMEKALAILAESLEPASEAARDTDGNSD